MYRDCDHLVDDTHVYTIRGNWSNNEKLVLAKPVYERETVRHSFEKIVDRKGVLGENLVWINPHSYNHISCKGIDITKYSGDTLWDNMVKQFLSIGITADNIGLFGSKRLNFKNCKDEDFIIYGRENLKLLYDNINMFKEKVGLYNHTLMHAKYQEETHGKYFNMENNHLLFCLLNKWSTCAFSDKNTTTIRFVDDKNYSGDILKQYMYQRDFSQSKTIVGVVSNAIETSFMPRIFYLNTLGHNKKIKVITPLWIFHQCVKENDLVAVTGTIIDGALVLRSYEHGIRFI